MIRCNHQTLLIPGAGVFTDIPASLGLPSFRLAARMNAGSVEYVFYKNTDFSIAYQNQVSEETLRFHSALYRMALEAGNDEVSFDETLHLSVWQSDGLVHYQRTYGDGAVVESCLPLDTLRLHNALWVAVGTLEYFREEVAV